MARVFIVNGRIYEETGERLAIVNGRILEETTAGAGPSGRIMGSLAGPGGLAGDGGIAGKRGGIAG